MVRNLQNSGINIRLFKGNLICKKSRLESRLIRGNVVPAVLIVMFFLPIGLQFLGNSVPDLAARYVIYDDAFYYLKIADNLYTKGMSSFDGIHSTNGYHPLWLVVLLFIRFLSNIEIFPTITLVLQILLFGSTGFLFFKLSRLLSETGSFAKPTSIMTHYIPSVIIVANPLLLLIVANGLDTSLSMFLLAGFFLAVFTIHYSHETSPDKNESYCSHKKTLILIAMGISAATVLARLDYVIPVLFSLVSLNIVRSIKSRKADRVFLILAVSTVSVILLYMVINKLLFDTFMPVSRIVKQEALFHALFYSKWYGVSTAAASVFWPNAHFVWLGNYKFIIIGLALSCIALASTHYTPRFRTANIILILQGWVHSIGYLILQSSGSGYYYIPIVISLIWSIYLIILAIRRILRESFLKIYERAISIAFFALAISGSLAFDYTLNTYRPKYQWRNDRFAAAEWISDNLPSDTRVGAWWAGALGYTARQPVINLDGLVNNIQFVSIVKQCDTGKYLIDEQISYLADYFPFHPLKDNVGKPEVFFPTHCWWKILSDLDALGYTLEIVRYWPDTHAGLSPDTGYYILRIKKRL